MKSLTVLLLCFCFTISGPAIASSDIPTRSIGIEGLDNDGYLKMIESENQSTEVKTDEKSYYRCYASPRYFPLRYYRYYGSSFNRRAAAIRAIRTCNYNVRRISFIAARYGCRLTYCYRFFK